MSSVRRAKSISSAVAARRNFLDTLLARHNFRAMAERTVQLVLHYDGARFAGWQRQRDARTIQGVLEDTLGRLCNTPTRVIGAGRTDAGVHARGQAAGASVPARWTIDRLRRAANALLPGDVWVAAAHEMRPEFHARRSALARRYVYYVGTDDAAHSPFRSPWEWAVTRPLDRDVLDASAGALLGEHTFRAYAVRGTAPAEDDHRCVIHVARWRDRPDGAGLTFEIEADRFLHHMVRFVVGTMVGEATGVQARGTVERLLVAPDNTATPPPAPAHALVLEEVRYPSHLYAASGP
jgi:tRNA pseudouridine38-40 synthase